MARHSRRLPCVNYVLSVSLFLSPGRPSPRMDPALVRVSYECLLITVGRRASVTGGEGGREQR